MPALLQVQQTNILQIVFLFQCPNFRCFSSDAQSSNPAKGGYVETWVWARWQLGGELGQVFCYDARLENIPGVVHPIHWEEFPHTFTLPNSGQ